MFEQHPHTVAAIIRLACYLTVALVAYYHRQTIVLMVCSIGDCVISFTQGFRKVWCPAVLRRKAKGDTPFNDDFDYGSFWFVIGELVANCLFVGLVLGLLALYCRFYQ